MTGKATAAAILLASAAAHAQVRPHATETAAPTPGPAAAVARFDAATAAARARFAAIPPDLAVAENLARRVEVEQELRRTVPNFSTSGLSEADARAANAAIWRRIAPVDEANTAYLKRVLPADGWFRRSRDGEEVARNAWLIVQHSPDQAFQRQVVARMAPLVKAGEASGPDYALLYDRTEMFAGRPQRYGSQMTCRAGRWVPAELEDPANLDARRAAVGLGPIARYMERFKEGC